MTGQKNIGSSSSLPFLSSLPPVLSSPSFSSSTPSRSPLSSLPSVASLSSLPETIPLADPEKILASLFRKQKSPFEFVIARTEIQQACERLFAHGWTRMTCLTGIDWETSWEVVYHITKQEGKDIVILRVSLPRQDPVIPTVSGIWPGAIWDERETFDLLGIHFAGNPDLRRILLPHDYDQHPLRKEVLHGNRS